MKTLEQRGRNVRSRSLVRYHSKWERKIMWQKVQRKRERKCGEKGGRTRQKRGGKENTMKGGGQAVREQEKEEEEVVVDGGVVRRLPLNKCDRA